MVLLFVVLAPAGEVLVEVELPVLVEPPDGDELVLVLLLVEVPDVLLPPGPTLVEVLVLLLITLILPEDDELPGADDVAVEALVLMVVPELAAVGVFDSELDELVPV